MALHTYERDPLEVIGPIEAGYLRLDLQTTKLVTELRKEVRMPWKNFLVEARHLSKDPKKDYRLEGRHSCEIVLDLNVAETAAIGRFKKTASQLSWANSERPWEPEDFIKRRNDDIYQRMADFIVARPIDVVLSPSHLAGGAGEPWLPIDIEGCHALRAALDRLDAAHVAIDYLLMAPADCFLESAWRSQMMEAVRTAPFERLWVRIGGFGHRHHGKMAAVLRALVDFHQLGRPIIADFCGGLAGLSLLASGAAFAIAHGVGKAEKTSFDNWMTPPPPPNKKDSGPPQFAYLGALDGYMDQKNFMAFLEPESRKDEFKIRDPDRYFKDRNYNFLRDRAVQFDSLFSHPPANRLRVFEGSLQERLWDLKQSVELDAANNLDVSHLERAHWHMSDLVKALTDLSADVRAVAAAAPFRGRNPGQRPFRLTG